MLNKVSLFANHSAIKKVYRTIENSQVQTSTKYIMQATGYRRVVIDNIVLLLIYLGAIERFKTPQSEMIIYKHIKKGKNLF